MSEDDAKQLESANRDARQRIADLKQEIARIEGEVERRGGQVNLAEAVHETSSW